MSWRISRAENLPSTCQSPVFANAQKPTPTNTSVTFGQVVRRTILDSIRRSTGLPPNPGNAQRCPDPPPTQRGSRPQGPTPTPRPAVSRPQISARIQSSTPSRNHHNIPAPMGNRRHPRRRLNDSARRHGLRRGPRLLELVRTGGLSLVGGLPTRLTREWSTH